MEDLWESADDVKTRARMSLSVSASRVGMLDGDVLGPGPEGARALASDAAAGCGVSSWVAGGGAIEERGCVE